MHSQTALNDIKKSLLSTIEMLERDNTNLRRELDDLASESKKFKVKDGYSKELNVTGSLNGLHFSEAFKDQVDDTTYELTAVVDSGSEECSIEVLAEASSNKVKGIVVNIEETSPLGEIKPQLKLLIKDLKVSETLNTISSFMRMAKLRSDIIDELLSLYGEQFTVDTKSFEEDDNEERELVIIAHDGKESNKYFELSWTFKWNPASIRSHTLKNLLEKLLNGCFFEADIHSIKDIWRQIGDAVMELKN